MTLRSIYRDLIMRSRNFIKKRKIMHSCFKMSSSTLTSDCSALILILHLCLTFFIETKFSKGWCYYSSTVPYICLILYSQLCDFYRVGSWNSSFLHWHLIWLKSFRYFSLTWIWNLWRKWKSTMKKTRK